MQAVPTGLRAAQVPVVASQKSVSAQLSDSSHGAPCAVSATHAVPSQRRPSAASQR